jgi:hypothetical protein
MSDRAAFGVLVFEYLNDALRHPLHRIRTAGAAPAVDIQLNL